MIANKLSIFCILVICLVGISLSEKIRYDNYKVFRIIPQNEEQRSFLLDLESNNPGFIFWKHVRNVGLPVDIMSPPHLIPLFDDLLHFGIKAQEMVNNVQSLIDVEALGSLQSGPELSWDAYHPFETIYEFMANMSASHPDICSDASYGTSWEGRDLRYVILNKGNTSKPIIWIDANIHAREWITNTIATWTLKELLEGDSQDWLDMFNFYILPVLNPDGYIYTQLRDRMWRKTRSNYANGTLCRGADPNRNWGFSWNTGGSSTDPCSDTFMGVSAFSEPEVLAASNLYDTIANDTLLYLSLHSYSQLILIPYGTNLGRVPDHDEHMSIGNAAAAAIRQRYGTEYTPGNIVELLYVASGSSGDHAKGAHNVDISFTFEMRDTGRYGFILPPEQIIPSCEEFMDGFHVILERVYAKHNNQTLAY